MKQGTTIKRIFTLVLGALAMIAVALVSAFISMRLAIHGREAVVPSLVGLSVSDAGETAARRGLSLNLENKFFSAGVPAGQILAQDPPAGSRVRREWPVRVTESLGPQSISIPDLTGQSERAATVSVRRLSLDLGAVAHLAVPGDPDVVIGQTPPVNSAGVDGPRISLLISDAEDAQPAAYVMPSLIGLPLGAANARAAAAGLHLVAAQADQPPPASPNPGLPASVPAKTNPWQALEQINLLGHSTPPPPARLPGVVVAQSPQPGRRVVQGDAVHVTIGFSMTAQPAAIVPQ